MRRLTAALLIAGLVGALMPIGIASGEAAIRDKIATFDPGSGEWTLHAPYAGHTYSFFYGIPGDVPLLGDWDCDGLDSIAMYRPSNGFVYLRNTNEFGVAEDDFFYGIPGDEPLVGDWNGDGCDTLAVLRGATIHYANVLGTVTAAFTQRHRLAGAAGVQVFSGDFDGDGVDSVGFREVASGRMTILAAPDLISLAHEGSYGTGPIVVGDWDGDGVDTWGTWAKGGGLKITNDRYGSRVEDTIRFGASGGPAWAGRFRVPRPPEQPKPDPAKPPKEDPAPKPEPSTRIPIYDTAWQMPGSATLDDADQYFASLAEAGFTGAWISYFHHLNGGASGKNVNGDPIATGGWGDYFQLNQNYLNHVRGILDAAAAHGQEVGIVAIWANYYVNNGQLRASNAWDLGNKLGQALGQHPAVSMWVMGGDNVRSNEDPNIWRNLVAGLRAAGAQQPAGYHAPPGDYDRFLWEDWLDFSAPETGHCARPEHTQWNLTNVVNATDKPVFAGEMRYEDINPSWCNVPGGPRVTPQHILEDIKVAEAAGISAIVYGHNDRWQWGRGLHGGNNSGSWAVLNSFGSEGERLMMDYLS